ncbi:peptidyl-prolyl cis-trans isomerase [Virgibacillus byunsanensis]|uniref:peptidylprolyl isomerase n=1 Tax=Virgibacillus byunsanensis TaxID=570945 RepID=A0ABW3LQM7_9BACI
MSRRLLLAIIVVLLITNIATLLFWNKEEPMVLDEGETQIDNREPVATIGEEEILYDNWMTALRNGYGKSQLKSMIDRTVVEKLAEEANIEISDKVIEREISLLKMTQGVMTQERTEKKEDEWYDDILYRYQLESLLTDETSIPEEEIRTHYDTYQKQYDFQASMQISHIVVQNSETADKVKEELDNGASFDLLAQEYSTDEESRDSGGYLGYFVNTSQFVPRGYNEVVSEMDEHTYSEPFHAESGGVAIVYLHSKLPSISFTYDEIKPYVENELALDELDQSLTVSPLWDKVDIDWIYEE